ncbi:MULTISPECIES: recombinase family protein [Sphingomonas]|uniref:recombinase family protein n=1 Tax=Sphingomonas TaxID=13687 RepID=UPI000DEEC76D|nr:MULTISPECIES: recombinase family protein [Sphingomonas]
MKPRRCAIYTRKSTEEGLEQSFNSLDAQREACGAYILSQAHEGWQAASELYDDGGWSGGNMERPALQQLLSDVQAGKVDVIVVYKVDRLTRSLADFARIVDILDKAGASFVSVTQAFNTTTSMGRLTLNVLLSFAQFEREVTSERIRDKIAASKRKGMWMGGPAPLGYVVRDRKLVIEPVEAKTVRILFRRYAEVRSIVRLVDELAQEGVTTTQRTQGSGRVIGGKTIYRGPLARLLKNPLYIGKVKHRDELYDGDHEAIIDPALWEEVQAILAINRNERKVGVSTRFPSLLTGMLTDPDGRPMTPVFTSRGGKRHHYYVSRIAPGEARQSAWRVPAAEVDRAVISLVQKAMLEQAASVGCIASLDQSRTSSERLPSLPVPEQRRQLLALALKAKLASDHITIELRDSAPQSIAIRLASRGNERRVITAADRVHQEPDPALVRMVALAMAVRTSALTGTKDSLVDHFSPRHRARMLKISFLAPEVLSTIIEGRQPADLTTQRFLRCEEMPLAWEAQRKALRL